MKTWWVIALLVGTLSACLPARGEAQVYGYTDERGVLVLSNVPTDSRMRVVAEESAESAGWIHRYAGQYDPLILKAATLAGLDSTLVKAVIAVESGFNRFARSHRGAQGLMQLMPETARRYGVSNPYDPWQNLRAGARHLRDLIDEFEDLHLALAAYNAGATPVRKLRGVPPYRETQNYVRKVLALYHSSSRISITKGSRTYSVAANGRTVIKPAGKRKEAGGAAALLAANREPKTESLPSGSTPAETDEVRTTEELLFFRYTDAEGIIYITRNKPPHENYEVLTP